jgi:hypothetical protein
MNTASNSGGGIFTLPNGVVNVGNSIVGGSIGTGGNCGGALPTTIAGTTNRTNHIIIPFPINTCDPTEEGFFIGTTDLRLGALQDNGGTYSPHTNTHELLTDSPALNAVPEGASCLAADQRGFERPSPDNSRCDIGAVEHQP